MFERQITNRFLETMKHIRYGALSVTTPDGKTHEYRGEMEGANASIIIHDWGVIGSTLRRGDIALAETYRDGLWDSPDPAKLFEFGMENQSVLDTYIYGGLFGTILFSGAVWLGCFWSAAHWSGSWWFPLAQGLVLHLVGWPRLL